MMQTALANPGLISLAAGFVDHQSLPVEAAARVADGLFADPDSGRKALQYGTTQGDPGLRHEIVAHLERGEGVEPGAFAAIAPRVVVTNGSQQLLYLVTEMLIDPGDIVLVESPTYFVFLGVLQTRGARVIGVGIDEGGMKLDALEATLAAIEAEGQLHRVKFIYTVCEHANPSGISLAEDRRGPMVDVVRRWSRHAPIYILEDAAYRGLNYEGAEPKSIWRHDPEGETVIYARTFSKTFSPGMKLGYGVLPAPLVAPLLDLKGNHDFGTSNVNQQVMRRILADGSYDRHLAGLIAMYREKRDIFLAAMDEHFALLEGEVTWTRPKGGLFVWLTAPEGVDLSMKGPVMHRCVEQGVLYIPGAFAFPDEPVPAATNHARLCFGVPSEADLVEGVRRLAASLSGCLHPVG
ncbi:PLP-dependent aminotransferase family protein [Tundrisphaera sp. TA3]|uniref:aminotransferase-like domain-containing protein n=1 Tax=Tundrisphaera sp. TA3 TaxID=3435775 RepID=UPI003EBC1FC0